MSFENPDEIQYDIPVVCAIIPDGNRILVGRRSRTEKSFPGLWELPGGKVRVSETHNLALIREIKEELDVLIYVEKEFFQFEHAYSDSFRIELTAYICEIVKGTPTNLVHDELRWVNAFEAQSLEWTRADIPIVEKFFSIQI